LLRAPPAPWGAKLPVKACAMPMLRTAVKNTFLDVEVVQQEQIDEQLPVVTRRSVSDFGCAALSMKDRSEEELQSLDAALNSKRSWHPSLRKILSISSLSTMMPDEMESEASLQKTLSMSSLSTMALDDTESEDGSAAQTKGFKHSIVPKTAVLEEASIACDSQADATTLMIRNIPNRYSQDELIDELEGLGFSDTFDFFYAPIDVGTMGNVGYAFVNFVDAAAARRCHEVLDGFTFEKHLKSTTSRRRAAKVSVAHLQGLEANLKHYEKSAASKKARGRRSGPVVMTVGLCAATHSAEV